MKEAYPTASSIAPALSEKNLRNFIELKMKQWINDTLSRVFVCVSNTMLSVKYWKFFWLKLKPMELILHNFIVHSRALSIVFQHLFHSILIRKMVLFYRSKFLQWLLKLMNSRLAVQQFSICQFNLIHNQTIPALKLNENHCFWWSKQIFFCVWTFFYFFIYYICSHFYCFGSLKVFVCFFFAVVCF